MSDNVFELKKITNINTEILQEPSSSKTEISMPSWLKEDQHLTLLMSALEDSEQREKYDSYLQRMNKVSCEMKQLTMEFNILINDLIKNEIDKNPSKGS